MSFFIGFLVLVFLVGVVFIFPLWAFRRIGELGDDVRRLKGQLDGIERELRKRSAVPPPAPAPATSTSVAHNESDLSAAAHAAQSAVREPTVAAPIPTAPAVEPISAQPIPAPPPVATPQSDVPPIVSAPPLLPPPPRPAVPPLVSASTASAKRPPVDRQPAVDWERFMGVNLSAWLGGLALFLGAAFFLKYSFEHDWIPPEVRAVFGFVFAAALVVGGLLVPRKRYEVTAQTLCASGIVCLYAVTFTCHSFYHFPFFSPFPTFALMVLITAVAFVLAVRMEGKVIAVLGMLGGFLTPLLVSTGEDNPLGLFTYLALLDAGLIAVALHRRWHFLAPLGAVGTVVMQSIWAAHFLNDAKTPTAIIISLSFDYLFLAGFAVAWRLKQISSAFALSVASLVGISFLFGLYFSDAAIATRNPGQFFGFLFLADLCLFVLAVLDVWSERLQVAGGLALFALLAVWTAERLNGALLPWALGAYLGFAALHSAFPLVLQKLRPRTRPSAVGQLFAPLALLLVLVAIFTSARVSFLVWPVVLIIDFLAIALAWMSASLIAVSIALLLTLGAAATWLFKLPASIEEVPSFLFVVGGFAVMFCAVGVWFYRKTESLAGEHPPEDRPHAGSSLRSGDPRAQLPILSALMPYLLVVMCIARMPISNPSAVFGLTLLLTVLTLGLARILLAEWLPACALAGVAAVISSWHGAHFTSAEASVALLWYLVFYATFGVFPFLFRTKFAAQRGPLDRVGVERTADLRARLRFGPSGMAE